MKGYSKTKGICHHCRSTNLWMRSRYVEDHSNDGWMIEVKFWCKGCGKQWER